MGGSDQWGNIVNGVELTRRIDQQSVFGLTTPLLTTASGQKMGKTEKGAVWLNKDRLSPYDYWQFWRSVLFDNAPNFYAFATSRPLDEIARPEVLARQQIGADHLRLRPAANSDKLLPQDEATFRSALVRRKQVQGLYASAPGQVTVIAGQLFRTQVHFPATLATGPYTAVVYLIRGGRIVHAQTTPLLVEKVGIGAEVYTFAHRQSAIYGLAAILIAVAAGWLAAAVFRKV